MSLHVPPIPPAPNLGDRTGTYRDGKVYDRRMEMMARIALDTVMSCPSLHLANNAQTLNHPLIPYTISSRNWQCITRPPLGGLDAGQDAQAPSPAQATSAPCSIFVSLSFFFLCQNRSSFVRPGRGVLANEGFRKMVVEVHEFGCVQAVSGSHMASPKPSGDIPGPTKGIGFVGSRCQRSVCYTTTMAINVAMRISPYEYL